MVVNCSQFSITSPEEGKR